MKAIRLEAIQVLSCIDVPPPRINPGHVLLCVVSCALCRTDAKMWRQGHRDLVLPRIPGHEIVGRVNGESSLFVVWPGDACGTCPDCLSGAENLCPKMRILGFHRDGGLAEYVAVQQSSLIPAPPGIPPEVAALSEPLACAVNALEQIEASPNDQLLIYGAGPVGLLMALAAQAIGAAPFIVETDPVKLRLSDRFRMATEIPAALETERSDFDGVVSAAPSPDALRDGLRRLKSRGRCCLFSGLGRETALDADSVNEIHYRQLRCVGAYGCTRRQMRQALDLLAARKREAALLIEEPIPIGATAAALARILDGHALKTVVSFIS